MVERTEATPAEYRALAHPLRLRIMRLCLHEARTNKQIAERLGQDPATTLHHVRTLVRTGFIAPDPVRNGAHGALEKPYRATGKSWTLTIARSDTLTSVLASLDAVRAEIADAGPDAVAAQSRLGLQLTAAEAAELAARLHVIAEEYAARPPTPGGDRYGMWFVLHRLAED